MYTPLIGYRLSLLSLERQLEVGSASHRLYYDERRLDLEERSNNDVMSYM